MRRSDKEVRDRQAADAVIRESRVCRLGLVDGDSAYVVPVCFGYDGESVFFHGAREGRKMDLLRHNPRVCVEFDIVDGVEPAGKPCGWGVRYHSVIAGGRAEVLEEPAEKRAALNRIMAQYGGGDGPHAYPDKMLEHTAVVRVPLEHVTAKHSRD